MQCAVCSEQSQGHHFGVETCRACAVFFRRSILSKRKLVCFSGAKKCKLEGSIKRGMCPFCRFKKCKDVGMTEENIQLNRDVNKLVEEKLQVKKSTDTCPNIAKSLQNLCITYDIGFMCVLTKVFTEFNPNTAIPMISCATSLKRMEIALIRHRQRRNNKEVLVKHLTLPFVSPLWGDEKLKAAEWFMFVEEFAPLPIDSKMIFFRNRWRLWRTLERLQYTMEKFGEKSCIEEKKFVFADGVTIDWPNLTIDMRPLSAENSDTLRRLFGPWIERYIDVVGNFLVKMKLESFEFTYLLCVLAFHIEDLPVCEMTHAAAVKFRDKCSTDLHMEYSSRGVLNYMDRLTAIFALVDQIEKIQLEFATAVELASVFDILHKNICNEHYES